LVRICHVSEVPNSPTHIELSLELFDALDTARSDKHLSSFDLLPLDTSEQGTHVVTGLSSLELLVEHF
jgi:hypothetical protein